MDKIHDVGVRAAVAVIRPEVDVAEFAPVTTVAEFRQLDEGDILEGYLDGFHGSPEPGSDRSRAYWHGWRNGRVDAGLAEPDGSQQALENEFAVLRDASG